MSNLDAQLVAAHAAGDPLTMVGLYGQAADEAAPAAQAFFLTQAMVFALEAGDRRAEALRARLVAMGCEAAPAPPAPPLR